MSSTIPQGTIYMFSCDKCPASESIGTPVDCTLIRLVDPDGVFQSFIIKNGEISHSVSKGYYGYAPDRSIFPLSQEEAGRHFSKHVCAAPVSSVSELTDSSDEELEGKTARAAGKTEDVFTHRRQGQEGIIASGRPKQKAVVYIPGRGLVQPGPNKFGTF